MIRKYPQNCSSTLRSRDKWYFVFCPLSVCNDGRRIYDGQTPEHARMVLTAFLECMYLASLILDILKLFVFWVLIWYLFMVWTVQGFRTWVSDHFRTSEREPLSKIYVETKIYQKIRLFIFTKVGIISRNYTKFRNCYRNAWPYCKYLASSTLILYFQTCYKIKCLKNPN